MLEKEPYAIQLQEVDWDDTSCLITYGPLPEKLILSIQTVGLIQKPVLQRKSDGLFRIICGSRRLAVCRHLGLDPVSCEVLSTSTSPVAGLRMAIYDNIAQRGLNPVEKSLVLTKMAQHVNQSQLVQEFMPLLDLEPSDTLCGRYMQLSPLEEPILDAIARGTLHERIGFLLSPLEKEDRLAFFNFFQELPFSVSVQEELVETVVEIGQRDNFPPRQVLYSAEVNELRRAHKRPARQRAQQIRRQLQAWRAPRLTARRERFDREARDLGLPSEVRLIPPPYFEGDAFRLEFGFRDVGEFKAIVSKLMEASERKELGEMIDTVP